jgi:hypothetical protein
LEKNPSVHISVFQFKFTNTQLKLSGRHVMQDIAAPFFGYYTSFLVSYLLKI